ncbi:hypothetical protein H5S09_03795 [Limosilactobacillus sp. STM2_1]|uniref:Uncharacterized protein n=1 Tax=Limosilactobacillus rudii TaxID=2759755 RepID=A0A7W3UL61_9LACO|nr:hypothetical protein [Limosilactobacillus rudii]MBB1079050.1 hypothetical protein [Limosilactobacillus rudii]MBB1097075.1 hypothetical protein [Limosilactobacillus rudii]MCD7134042.1 hypothetical protein [Limosilactobacillus rudii]
MTITPEATVYRVNMLYVTGQSVSELYKTQEEAEKKMNEFINSGEVASISIVRHHWTEWRKGGTCEHQEKRLKHWIVSPEKVAEARQNALENY